MNADIYGKRRGTRHFHSNTIYDIGKFCHDFPEHARSLIDNVSIISSSKTSFKTPSPYYGKKQSTSPRELYDHDKVSTLGYFLMSARHLCCSLDQR